ncbi:MAG: acyltransferase family protein [Lachnospiraceae bacterium]|nr:acyltransferase family protein [Lachnospiraceae bacterium]
MEKKRIHIEAIRIFACFFVIFNHTGLDGFFLFCNYPAASFQYWFYLILSICCRVSVPLFFAVSGALLIPKEERTKDLYLHRVLRMVIILIVISAIYYVWRYRYQLSTLSFGFFFKVLLASNHADHLWYFYSFIPFLMALPLIRVLAKNMTNCHFLYMTILAIASYAIRPILEYLIWQGSTTFNGFLKFSWITANAIIYPCIGYYMENRMDIKKVTGKKLAILWAVNVACLFLASALTLYKAKITGVCSMTDSQTFHNVFVLVNVIALYVTARFVFDRVQTKPELQKALVTVSGTTFGIFLLHLLLMEAFKEWGVLNFFTQTLHFNDMVSAMLFCLTVMAAGFVIFFLLKKIPFFKKYL